MQLTRFTDYSLRALMYLGNTPEKVCTVKEIAEFYAVSQNHMVKIVHNLSKLGYIQSSKGKGGGIKLLITPDKINLKGLVMQLEPNLYLVECFDLPNNRCSISNNCKLKQILHKSLGAFLEVLDQYTLEDICSGRARLV